MIFEFLKSSYYSENDMSISKEKILLNNTKLQNYSKYGNLRVNKLCF